MDLETLCKLNYENPPNENISRKPVVIRAYTDYLETDGPEIFKKNLHEKLSKDKFYFYINMFPYDVVKPINHSCLWYKGETNKEEVTKYLNNHNIKYVTFFENPEYLKSVKDVSHFHVFHY